MKVVNICVDDHANFMWNIHKSLLTVGVDSYAYKLNPHPFNYPEQADLINPSLLNTIEADIVLIHHSDWELEKFFTDRIAYFHTGTKYRTRKDTIRQQTQYAELNLIALPEFHNTGLTNEHYVIGSVEEPKGAIGVDYKFGHFPSNPDVKGTDIIIKAFKDAGVPLTVSTERVGYAEQLNRMQKAQVIVELFNPMLGGNMYGSFGMTALEAASYRKVVLTHNITGQELYQKTYGECELVICNTYNELKNNILKYNNIDVYEKANATYLWWTTKHSPRATGQRVAELLNGVCR